MDVVEEPVVEQEPMTIDLSPLLNRKLRRTLGMRLPRERQTVQAPRYARRHILALSARPVTRRVRKQRARLARIAQAWT